MFNYRGKLKNELVDELASDHDGTRRARYFVELADYELGQRGVKRPKLQAQEKTSASSVVKHGNFWPKEIFKSWWDDCLDDDAFSFEEVNHVPTLGVRLASHLLPPGCNGILLDGVHALTSASSKEFSMIKDIDGLNPKSLSKALKDVSKTMVPSLVTDDTKKEAAAASGHVPLKLVQPKMKCERPKGLDNKSDPTDLFAGL